MPSELTHTADCLHAFQRHEDAVKLFESCFPHYCRECQGWGSFISTYDPSPAGVSLGAGYFYDVEPCPCCEGHELPHCSLCGQICTEHGERLCTCPPEVGYPHPPECWCWEASMAWNDDSDAIP